MSNDDLVRRVEDLESDVATLTEALRSALEWKAGFSTLRHFDNRFENASVVIKGDRRDPRPDLVTSVRPLSFNRRAPAPAVTMATMPLYPMHMVWGLALVVAALVLGNKESNPLPWAVAALGVLVFIGAYVAQLAADDAEKKSVKKD